MRDMMPVHPDFRKYIEDVKKQLEEESGVEFSYTQLTKALEQGMKNIPIGYEEEKGKKKKRFIKIELE